MDNLPENLSFQEAIDLLIAGNRRFVQETPENPNRGPDRRRELTEEQHPFAVVLSCADSRVIPSMIFDRGLGDLFVIRVAGNIVDDVVISSVEFAVEQLGVRLIVLLGHENCGAVRAAIDGTSGGKLASLTAPIQSAVEAARRKDGDLLENAIRLHAHNMAENLRNDEPILARRIERGEIKILPAYYELGSGRVEILKLGA